MQIHPQHQEGLNLQKQAQHEAAVRAFTHALVDQENPDIYNDRGVSYFHLGKLDQAYQDMNYALELEPHYSYRYSARAYILDRQGDTKSAIQDYRKAIELDPEDAIAHNNLGLVEEKAGYQEKAGKSFDLADQLAKEQGLFPKDDVAMPPAENKPAESDPVPDTPSKPQPTPAFNHQSNATGSGAYIREMLRVFKDKGAFGDFIRFVRNGFRNND